MLRFGHHTSAIAINSCGAGTERNSKDKDTSVNAINSYKADMLRVNSLMLDQMMDLWLDLADQTPEIIGQAKHIRFCSENDNPSVTFITRCSHRHHNRLSI